MYAFVYRESDLTKLAEEVLKTYSGYKVFTFEGDLGAGKTSFIKVLCKQLNIQDDVSSPTFSLVNEYERQNGDAIFHMDLYRLEEEHELLNVGFEDYLYSGSYCFIEWPAIASSYYEDHVHVKIEIIANEGRFLTFEAKKYGSS